MGSNEGYAEQGHPGEEVGERGLTAPTAEPSEKSEGNAKAETEGVKAEEQRTEGSKAAGEEDRKKREREAKKEAENDNVALFQIGDNLEGLTEEDKAVASTFKTMVENAGVPVVMTSGEEIAELGGRMSKTGAGSNIVGMSSDILMDYPYECALSSAINTKNNTYKQWKSGENNVILFGDFLYIYIMVQKMLHTL